MQRPISLEHLTLLEATHCWSFSPNRKKIHGNKTCVTKLLESIHISLPFLPVILHLLNHFVGVKFFYTNLFGLSLMILEPQLLKLFLIGITLKAHMLCGILNVQKKSPLHLYPMIQTSMLLPFCFPIP